MQSWVDVAVASIEGIITIGDDEFDRVLAELPKFVNRDATAFRRTSRLKKLTNGAYLETNLSAAAIHRLCAQAAQLAGLGPEEWSVAYSAASDDDGDDDEPEDEPSSLRKLQQEFWMKVCEELTKTGEFRSLRSPRPQHWFAIALGRTGVHLSLSVNAHAGVLAVKVVLMPERAQEYLDALMTQKPHIEQELGMALVWNAHPEKPVKTIKVTHAGSLRARDGWPSAIEWLVQTAVTMRKTFAPRVSAMGA